MQHYRKQKEKNHQTIAQLAAAQPIVESLEKQLENAQLELKILEDKLPKLQADELELKQLQDKDLELNSKLSLIGKETGKKKELIADLKTKIAAQEVEKQALNKAHENSTRQINELRQQIAAKKK